MSFIGTLVFTALSMLGLGLQCRRIWRERSGQSVSVAASCFFGSLCGAFMLYGVYAKSVAIVFNGSSVVIFVPLLIGLWRFKGFSRTEKWLAALFTLMVPTVILTSHKVAVIGTLLVVARVPSALIPYEIWKNQCRGVVDIRLTWILLCSAIFWTVYAFSIGNIVLQVTNPISAATMIATLILWHKYPLSKSPDRAF